MNKNIFITGAEGFIGSHLVEQLAKNGYNIKALVEYNWISFRLVKYLEKKFKILK